MELYLGTEDSISQSEIQFLIEKEKEKEKEEAEGNEKRESTIEEEDKKDEIVEKEAKGSSTEPINPVSDTNKKSGLRFIPIVAIIILILSFCFYNVYAVNEKYS